ncbi:MAG: phosphopyruvate hydratase [Elusimicrobia bacterium]|nr:phosphopyruvate hydratase [Elusimicrobiota bacterium]
MSRKIRSVHAREIIDSRGFPTVEAEVRLESGHVGRAAVPSGASTGEHEAVELRDGDPKRYFGKGVLKAVRHVEQTLAPALLGRDASDQAGIDERMLSLDGTPNKGKLGANALLSVSMAASRAAAQAAGAPLYRYLRQAFSVGSDEWLLPAPMLNIINGGKHADSGLDVQEFMVVPAGAPSFTEALRVGAEVYQALKKLLAEREESTAVGDEGGFAPRLKSHDDAIEVILEAIQRAGAKGVVSVSLDAAASEFYHGGSYKFEGKTLSGAALAARYAKWVAKHPMLSIEDPFDQDDWSTWKAFTASEGSRLRIVGDDLFVTNVERLRRGIEARSANSILIKLNQIGTVTETVRAVQMAQKSGFSAIISHRSGETEDPYIADLAVALNAGAIKTGAPCRSERLAKYNQLLRIEEELGADAVYAGARAFLGASKKATAKPARTPAARS